MSLDRLRVGSTRTVLSGPDTYENSALTSATRGVALGGGFDVTEAGLQTVRPYPNTGIAQSVAASAHTFTAAMLASTVVRITADGAAATGAIMPTASTPGQLVTFINTGRHNISFNATVATSNVAGDGTMVARILSYSSSTFVAGDSSRWYVVAGGNR